MERRCKPNQTAISIFTNLSLCSVHRPSSTLPFHPKLSQIIKKIVLFLLFLMECDSNNKIFHKVNPCKFYYHNKSLFTTTLFFSGATSRNSLNYWSDSPCIIQSTLFSNLPWWKKLNFTIWNPNLLQNQNLSSYFYCLYFQTFVYLFALICRNIKGWAHTIYVIFPEFIVFLFRPLSTSLPRSVATSKSQTSTRTSGYRKLIFFYIS